MWMLSPGIRELSLLLALYFQQQVGLCLSKKRLCVDDLGAFLCKRFLGVFKNDEPKTDMEQNEKPGKILQSIPY